MSCAVKEHSDLFCNPEAEAYVGKLVDDYLEGERMSDTDILRSSSFWHAGVQEREMQEIINAVKPLFNILRGNRLDKVAVIVKSSGIELKYEETLRLNAI